MALRYLDWGEMRDKPEPTAPPANPHREILSVDDSVLTVSE